MHYKHEIIFEISILSLEVARCLRLDITESAQDTG